MARKTITIDIEAYHRLKLAQKPDESFSQTIKRVVRPPLDLEAWMEEIRRDPLSKEAIEAIDHQIKARRRSPCRER